MYLASYFFFPKNNQNYNEKTVNRVTNLIIFMLFVAKGAELDTGIEQQENNPFLIRRYSEELSSV